jgi:hypothetical protein
MKFIDNRVKEQNPKLKAGDIVIGQESGHHYLVLEDNKVLKLETFHITTLTGLCYSSVIKKESITITFEGVK